MSTKTDARTRPAEVLLVEDNEDDVLLTVKGFELSRLMVNLHTCENGLECMKFLRREEPYADAPTPDLILLDLNMPVMNGHEVLKAIESDIDLRRIPLVVLSTSAEFEDVRSAYASCVNSYIRKPVDFPQFTEVIQQLGTYWFKLVVLP